MDLGKYLKVGLHWWWLILLSVILSATASYFYSQGQPRVYAARTTLMVGASIIENTNPNEQDLGLSRTLAEVYSELALRRPITQAVIDRLGLEMQPDELSQMIQTSVIPSAQLLEIFVLDVHPQRAQLLANTVAEELILQSPGGGGGEQERDKFIRAQLEDLQGKIEDTNTKIETLEDALSNMTSAVEIAEAQSQLTQLEQLKSDYQNNYNQFLTNVSEASPNRLAIFEPA
ncbi:MAG TPA: Wzz/FepE/Etk N-terminal domain-containing protein, partial [Anaerolineae bacterium]|nr:Wzz/FepE/Etk N-terminal domain-containing protein [Anaerolineae bacterium]